MRRTRLDVICSMLVLLEAGRMKPTPLMSKANLPHDLFKKYLAQLEKAGLVKQVLEKNVLEYELTDEGRQYAHEYRRFLKFSASFGL